MWGTGKNLTWPNCKSEKNSEIRSKKRLVVFSHSQA